MQDKVQQLFGPSGLSLLWAASALAAVWLYFTLPSEPNVTAIAALSTLAYVAMAFGRRWAYAGQGLSCVFVALLTVCICAAHSKYLSVPFLPDEASGQRIWITGTIDDIEPNPSFTRLTLSGVTGYGFYGDQVPSRVRITVHTSRAENATLGATVSTQAQLFTPSRPVFEGDYPSRRSAYFKRLGAMGMTMGDFYITPPAKQSLLQKLADVRQNLAAKLGARDGVAAALLTGLRGYVAEADAEAFRASGLAHLMAISGLHVGMVAGMVYFALQKLFALWPRLVLFYPTRRIAALMALLATAGYAVLAGMSIPTMRALVMVTALLVAVILDRIRLSLHILSLTAILAIWLWPEAALGPSFQMSFLAALALVLWSRQVPVLPRSQLGLVRQFGYFKGVWATSLVAGLATLPLAAMHFGTLSLAGFFTNMVAIPLMGFVVMPLALLTLITNAFGGVAWVDGAYAQACAWLTHIAHTGANWDWTYQAPTALLPLYALLAWGAVICLIFRWRRSAIGVGLAFIMLAVGGPMFLKTPDLIAFDGGRTVLLREKGSTYYPAAQQGTDAEKQFLKRLSTFRSLRITDTPMVKPVCDSVGCVHKAGAYTLLALAPHQMPEADDCTKADLIFGGLSPQATGCANQTDLNHYYTKEITLKPHALHQVVYTPKSGRPWH